MTAPCRTVVAAVLATVVLVSCGVGTSASGKAAPALRGTTLTGRPWSLADQRGHPVVVAFQASTCEPCKAELPKLRAFALSHPDVRLVSVGLAETPADFRAFLAPYRIVWPAIADREGYLSEAWGVQQLPVTVVVDADGRVVKRYSGAVSADELARVTS